MRRYTAEELKAYAEQRSEQKRIAQQRYRQVHAERLSTARRIGQILTRQADHHGDIEKLASLITNLVGKDYARALGRELAPRK
jgi:hypothetical protein